MKFIRYGSLKPQYHNTSDVWEYIHTPPVEYGIYAFPNGMVEPFLLGGIGSGSLSNGRYKWYKDNSGNKVYMTYYDFCNFIKTEYKGKDILVLYESDTETTTSTDVIEYDLCWQYQPEKKYPVYILNKPNIFNYNGLIWHHLYKNKNDKYAPYYLKRIGHWVLSDIKTYEKCLKRAIAEKNYWSSMERQKYKDPNNGCKITNYMGYPKSYSKDEFEVYIEKI